MDLKHTEHSWLATPSTPGEANMVLYPGLSVPKPFYDRIKESVQEILPAMQRGEHYTLEMLCDEELWDSLGDGNRRKAGQCMAFMVRNDEIPQLTFAPTKHEYPKMYMLR